MQAKAQLGGNLQFTRIALGAGQAASSSAATALADERMTENIQTFTNGGNGRVVLSVVFSNLGLVTGFGMSEVGVFALDPTTSVERLYAYAKTSSPDFFQAAGGPTIQEEEIEVDIAVGSAANVVAVIDDMVILATKDNLKRPTNHVDLAATPDTAAVTVRQRRGASYVDGIKLMGFGGIAIPIALGAVPTPPSGIAYLYVRTNGLATPNTRLSVCVKLPDGNDAVICTGDPS
jgi:hypothetical protein